MAEQVRAKLSAVALPDAAYGNMSLALANERAISPVAAQEARIRDEIDHVQAKLDRLLDTHLEGLIDKATYVAKKDELLNRRIELQEQLTQVGQRATGRLEPSALAENALCFLGVTLGDPGARSAKEGMAR